MQTNGNRVNTFFLHFVLKGIQHKYRNFYIKIDTSVHQVKTVHIIFSWKVIKIEFMRERRVSLPDLPRDWTVVAMRIASMTTTMCRRDFRRPNDLK